MCAAIRWILPNRPIFSPFLRAEGTSCKTIFDCTVPYHLKERFRRAEFLSVDLAKFLPDR